MNLSSAKMVDFVFPEVQTRQWVMSFPFELRYLMAYDSEITSLILKLFTKLRGHFNYFGLAGNGKALSNFRYKVILLWRRVLSRRSQVSKLSWEKMSKLITKHGIITAKLKIPYHKLSSYVIV